MRNDQQLSFIVLQHTHFQTSFLVCSCGTQNDLMVQSRWCIAPVWGSSTGVTPSSLSSMRTTVCCWCLVFTWAHITRLLGKSLWSVWVGIKIKSPTCDSDITLISRWCYVPHHCHTDKGIIVIYDISQSQLHTAQFNSSFSPELLLTVWSPFLCTITENYTLLSRVRNKPYDVFGCWLNETHLISGNLHWIGNMTSCSVLWLNKAFQVRPSAAAEAYVTCFFGLF